MAAIIFYCFPHTDLQKRVIQKTCLNSKDSDGKVYKTAKKIKDDFVKENTLVSFKETFRRFPPKMKTFPK